MKRGNIFKHISAKKPKRNLFDLSHERKFSMNMGDLVPIMCQEVVPGDTFRMNTEVFMRLAPMLAPIMHRVNVYTHFFFVPNRLTFDGWEKFITGGVNGQDDTVYPVINVGNIMPDILSGPGSLMDYLGIPPLKDANGAVMEFPFSALPFRAYQMIYNEYYRDQTLSPEVEFDRGSIVPNSDVGPLLTLRRRCWEKDYFTSALPWPQRGGDVMLPLTGDADVEFVPQPGTFTPSGRFVDAQTGLPLNSGANIDTVKQNNPSFGAPGIQFADGSSDSRRIAYDPNGSLKADMSEVSSTTINELRRSIRLQEWLEKNARAGSRYIEQIFSHFGVKSSDARLQRPEYLGGGKSPVTISEVLQTSSTDQITPQGNMSGHGVAVGNTHGFKRFFEEHGFVIGIMSVLPRTAYQDGLPRMFSKFDRFDHFWPEFANIGEQAILNQELFIYDSAGRQEVFGYTPRYAEYKYVQSTVHGDFRKSLAYWHMGRKFNNLPTLSAEFVQSDPTHDIFAVTDPSFHKLYVQIYNNLRAIRPMPVFGTPVL